MANMLQDGAAWLGAQHKAHCGQAYQYSTGITQFEITLVPDELRDQQRRDQPEDEAVDARTKVFNATSADLVIDDVLFVPQAGHQIWREVEGEQPEVCTVFPAFSQYVFKHPDPYKKLIRIFAVLEDDLEELFYTPPQGEPFMWDVVLSEIRGDLMPEDSGDVVKVMRQTAYGATQQLIDNGVTELQRNAKFGTSSYTDWSVDLSQSAWGDGRVKLELVRKPISTLRNMERNAAL